MLKKIIILSIITSFILAPYSFSPGNINLTQADTIISSNNITQDTIWTPEGSPYFISGTIIIPEGITLTIEPGVISAGDEETFNFNYQEDGEIPKIIIQKEINSDGLLKDLNELYRDNEIKKKFVYRILKAEFSRLSRIYDKIESKRHRRRHSIKKLIKLPLKIINKQLSFYLSRGWITPIANDVLQYDINSLINKLVR